MDAAPSDLSPDTVAALIADPATRSAALDALEAHSGAHDEALALAAGPALTDVMLLDADQVGHELFQRVGLLRARLVDEAADSHAVFGSALNGGSDGGRWKAQFTAPDNVIARAVAKAPEEIDEQDALSYACMWAAWPSMFSSTYPTLPGDDSAMDHLVIWATECHVCSA